MLRMLENVFEPVWTGGELSQKAFEAVATMEMTWPHLGEQKDSPLVGDFLAAVHRGREGEPSP